MALDIAEVGNSFASKICNSLFSKSGNVFFSPWSLFDSLAMVHVGARHNTAKQLTALLGYPEFNMEDSRGPNQQVNACMQKFITSLSDLKNSETDFGTTNKIWMQKDFEILEEFKRTLLEFYLSNPELINFAKSPEEARSTINSWVEKTTNGKIQDLIPSGIITNLTKLILTNAVYFKGSWVHAFKPTSTLMRPFTVDDGTVVDVQMMYMKATKGIRYHETESYQVLGLPYIGNRLAMTVVLPRATNGVKSILESMVDDNSLISTWITAELTKKPIEIHLPKFKVTFFAEFNELLCSLGATEMFDQNCADFSGISANEALHVASVVQKAFIKVDEKGTEAAAATSAAMMVMCIPMRPVEPIVFRADHPFVFFIADTESKMVIFLGKVDNPA